ncbi:hypothetical protein [Zestomonas carbonaria]|uniref:DUF4440 domain-containing protein n=1 Tax=Zestomonas carbonaria TaxID=2762745 RepID=A0A7U7EKH3_9GAMM|nr:hypothetical protein [Pseudomonas carbonaria]CAD5105785.1 hypothetical protein PSEWESI4_00042 [Pseudomonas carbonaria]
MSPRIFTLPLLLAFALLAGCGRDDPQASLEAAVQQLQDNIEAKKTSAVLDQLAGDFRALQAHDRDWARSTMTMLFLRYRNIQIIAPTKRSWLDPAITSKGYTEAKVGVTGAEGLIPDSARLYDVKLEWWMEDGDWKLARVEWE